MSAIRILQVVPNMDSGGLENFIMNVYHHLDRNQVQFDFLVHYRRKCFFDDEIVRLGGKIYRLSVREDNRFIKYEKELNHFFREHPEYRVVHGHMASFAPFYLHAAKKNGVSVRIVHSHNTNTEKNLKGYCKRQLLRFAKRDSNVHFACSDDAGKFLFGKTGYTVVPNAIDTEKFRFDPETRRRTRQQLGLENQFVVGHIGRFNTQKNHLFLLDIFSEIVKRNPASVLLLIGKGETENSVRKKVDSMGLRASVRFLGVRPDVEQIYQAMDAFVLPSLFEGLPVVGVEAQAAGLPCYFSDRISSEIRLTQQAHFLSLSQPACRWADEILKCGQADAARIFAGKAIQENYDIHTQAKKLQNFYRKVYGEGL